MEIKTTNQILEIEHNISPDSSIMGNKEFEEYSKKHNIFSDKKWVAVDDVLSSLKHMKGQTEEFTHFELFDDLIKELSNSRP